MYRTVLAALLAVWFNVPAGPASAQQQISVELVLAVDTSTSVDEEEHALIVNGMADAFRQPDIIAQIGQHDGVAVTLFQWGTVIDSRYAIPWHVLTDEASILDFAARIERIKRDPDRGLTAIGDAIRHSVELISSNGFDGREKKIDIAGDGRNNVGVVPEVARRDADAFGIVINGLPILSASDLDNIDLVNYFRDNIITGPGAFVEVAQDYEDFANAFRRKLQRELMHRIGEGTRGWRRAALR